MRARDTSPQAAAILNRVHETLGPAGRFELALDLSRLAREFAKAALRDEYPTYSEEELTRELTRRLHPQVGRKYEDGR